MRVARVGECVRLLMRRHRAHGGAAEGLASACSPWLPRLPLVRLWFISLMPHAGKGHVLGLLQAGSGIFLWEVRPPATEPARLISRTHGRTPTTEEVSSTGANLY